MSTDGSAWRNSALLDGCWWQLWGASWCISSGAEGEGALPRGCCVWGGIWGYNSFWDWELSWFATGTKPKSSAVWKALIIQPFLAKWRSALFFSERNKDRSWNPGIFYAKENPLTSQSVPGYLFVNLLIGNTIIYQKPWAGVNNT